MEIACLDEIIDKMGNSRQTRLSPHRLLSLDLDLPSPHLSNLAVCWRFCNFSSYLRSESYNSFLNQNLSSPVGPIPRPYLLHRCTKVGNTNTRLTHLLTLILLHSIHVFSRLAPTLLLILAEISGTTILRQPWSQLTHLLRH